LLDDSRYDISASVRQALVTLALNVPEAVGVLATQIAGRQSWTLDHTVLEGLAQVGEGALVPLREQLKASEARTREAAALALGWLNDQEARGVLGELSESDSMPEVREAAAIAATYLRVVKPGFRPASFSPY
jgi:HEAT repeat protein